MLLENKNAVIYGGGGKVGGAVARAFAREGATVHLAGRTRAPMESVARDIRDGGGTATIAQVDALVGAAVDAHADDIARAHGTLNISMNLISTGDVQGIPLVEMTLADFERPIHNVIRSTYLTARAAARHMIRQGSGVILVFGGEGDPIRDGLVESLVGSTLLGHGAMLDDVGNVAAFAASDRARTITASAINITCGAIIT